MRRDRDRIRPDLYTAHRASCNGDLLQIASLHVAIAACAMAVMNLELGRRWCDRANIGLNLTRLPFQSNSTVSMRSGGLRHACEPYALPILRPGFFGVSFLLP